jgi:hypothetical protein
MLSCWRSHFRMRVFFLTAAGGPFASLFSSGVFEWLAANLGFTWFHSLAGWFSATALFSFWTSYPLAPAPTDLQGGSPHLPSHPMLTWMTPESGCSSACAK